MAPERDVGNILVVDDNEMNCEMLELRLAQRGYSVATATGGRQALDMTAEHEFDLIILDIMMPEVSGLDVLREVRREHTMADLPVIMATAKFQSEDIVEALGLGANDYVTKPIDFAVLSARIRTQLQLKRLSQQKDEFVRIASHDLKNPLTVVRGYAKVLELFLKQEPLSADKLMDIVMRIDQQTKTMERIITDFLDFQALEDGQIAVAAAPASINAIAKRVTENLVNYASEKGIPVTLELAQDVPMIPMDEARIEQVLQNLVGNAIKFSFGGSEVVVRTSIAGDGAVLAEVADSGPGLSEDDMRRLFVKYARLSNKPTGGEKSSGLGLAICKNLVQLHGGEIGARNNSGKHGATFWFRLPAKTAGHPASEPSASASDASV